MEPYQIPRGKVKPLRPQPILLTASLACALACACATARVRPAPFRVRPDSVSAGDLRGPFDGRVLDAETGRPVAGALVYGAWSFVQGFGLNAPAGWREHVATTDSNGRYRVPRLERLVTGPSVRLADFTLIVYKKGFVAYRSDRRFEDFGTRTDFAQRHHVVALERWRPEQSHVRHLAYVGGGATLAALTSWELPEAAAELGGKKVERKPTRTLLAGKLLTVDDVKKATGFAGQFDVGELGDEPGAADYDSVHLRAKDQPESYDVALRVWVLDLAEAQKHYGRLIQELPNAQERNEVGDRSLRSTSDARDIFGVAFLDGRKGVVVLLTCGASQCRSLDVVVGLARVIKDRADAVLGSARPGGGK